MSQSPLAALNAFGLFAAGASGRARARKCHPEEGRHILQSHLGWARAARSRHRRPRVPPDCGERLRFVAAIMLSTAVRQILRDLGLPSDL